MTLIEDDSILHPEINADSLLYICALSENSSIYTRFFDALLIKRTQHRSFFRDLQAFRQQPRVIAILEKAQVDKTKYKEITLAFLDSRFSHPWCRKLPLKKGFWRAEWGTIDGKQKDAETVQEEQRLHNLLVPIWVIMRSKMFPGDDIVKTWCAEERSRLENSKRDTVATSLNPHNVQLEHPSSKGFDGTNEDDLHSHSDEDEEQRESQSAAHAATSVFRLAAAGVILSQTPKRKLRWLIKKS